MLLIRPSVPCRIQKDPGKMVGAQACLFVSYSSSCTIKPHVRFHLEALAARGFKVILIVTVDGFSEKLRLPKCDAADGMVVRTNAGFDFGAWADAFRLFPTLWTAGSVLLVNDSVFGPFGDFDAVLAGVRALPADVVALTDSYEISHHIQSFFTLLKSPALQNEGVRKFWRGVANIAGKESVIRRYELEMRPRYESYGLTCKALFPSNPENGANPTLDGWRELVRRGFPYFKVYLLRNPIRKYDLTGCRELITVPALLTAIETEIGPLPEANAHQTAGPSNDSGEQRATSGKDHPQP